MAERRGRTLLFVKGFVVGAREPGFENILNGRVLDELIFGEGVGLTG